MEIKNLTLQNFRNFAKKSLEFRDTTIILGPNASGKTNILEAIYLLSTGKSFRAELEREMIRSGKEFTRVKGRVAPNNEQLDLEAVVTTGEVGGKGVARKKLTVNGVFRRLYNFAGSLKVVIFGPWDLGLVTGSPGGRRRFLDGVLSQVDREYRRSLLSYEKGLRQRNKLLERIRDGEAQHSQLLFWDRLLIKNGNYISEKRTSFIDFVNTIETAGEEKFSLGYDKSTISAERIERYARQEVLAAATLVGPHRDDIKFKVQNAPASPSEAKYRTVPGEAGRAKFKVGNEGRDLAVYGSRGEQRMAVLWLKLAELKFIEQESGENPVLLLDDIFSELDHRHRRVVMNIVGKQQTIITTADPHTIEGLKATADIIELS